MSCKHTFALLVSSIMMLQLARCCRFVSKCGAEEEMSTVAEASCGSHSYTWKVKFTCPRGHGNRIEVYQTKCPFC
ncbi:hypothetical protein PGT21_022719 [Puccinia graminis f. sp. tritici]|uniref:Secreted protein n=1 Tax=Puccinia graminis f. sp. tritici TaxID=56615 RepID=A0A5B0RK10_PUCGR|nr:hypothetical protein PGTUg99_016767 [Puccinia graminis f. sp. tritici]KAA1091073.1 hypothetical protein PGT21_022719 [Puccinia graminis f. sp. tritici]KAA1125458.1 hypothetical protein PGTUg99_017265 [Puccinia graminis f. sp. tritici]